MRCDYCYYLDKERLYRDTESTTPATMMPEEYLERYIRQYIEAQPEGIPLLGMVARPSSAHYLSISEPSSYRRSTARVVSLRIPSRRMVYCLVRLGANSSVSTNGS